MSSKISIGSTVFGSAGVGRKVLSIDGDTLTIETSEGEGIISMSRVLRWEAPPATPKASKPQPRELVLGDSVRYIGTNPTFKQQYSGVLTIWELGKGVDFDKCACLTEGGKVSTWIEYKNLKLIIEKQAND